MSREILNLAAFSVVEPLSFLDIVVLELAAKLILSDFVGVQKEVIFYSVLCITMRDETEWVETVKLSWSILAGVSCGILWRLLEKNLSGKNYRANLGGKKIF